MKKALTAPTKAPTSNAMRTATGIGTPFFTLRIATSVDVSVSVLATERSKSPAVSGMMRPRVKTTMIALKPSIEA